MEARKVKITNFSSYASACEHIKFARGRFFVCVFSFCEVPFSLAQNRISPVAADTGVQDTQKIKIISAFCIDGKWSFNIYDGVKIRLLWLRLGAEIPMELSLKVSTNLPKLPLFQLLAAVLELPCRQPLQAT